MNDLIIFSQINNDKWVIDFKNHKWATSMKKFLNKLNDEVNEYGGVLPEEIQKKRINRYQEIIKSGNPECPIMMPAKGSGRTKVIPILKINCGPHA